MSIYRKRDDLAITDYFVQNKKLNIGEDSMKTCQKNVIHIWNCPTPVIFLIFVVICADKCRIFRVNNKSTHETNFYRIWFKGRPFDAAGRGSWSKNVLATLSLKRTCLNFAHKNIKKILDRRFNTAIDNNRGGLPHPGHTGGLKWFPDPFCKVPPA